MLFRGRMAELIVKTDLKLYGKYLVKGRNISLMLCVQLKKVLYGLLRSSFLLYEKLVGDLEANGFKLIPYYFCVDKKMVKGKRLAICWHMDDIKISHVDRNMVPKK